jgi:DUF4097 and DUF4098 domain-containing protein YvlB
MASSPYTQPPNYPPGYRPPAPRSLFGPVVLISIGIMFLLATTGMIPHRQMFSTFARYWPVLLILWGVAKIIDHQQARKHGYRTPGMGAGGVFLLVMLTLVGLGATGAYRVSANLNQDWFRENFDIDDDDFGGMFGKRFEYTQELPAQALPANGSIKVNSERGAIKLIAGTDDQVRVRVLKTVYADTQQEADKLNQQNQPTVKLDGSTVVVDAGRINSGAFDFEITAPKKAPADVLTQRGDIEVRDREGNVKLQTMRGDTTLENIVGNAEVHMRNGDLAAKNIKGDLLVEGRVNDTAIADVTGVVTLQGDFMGDMALARLGKGLRFQSSRTDLDIAKLDGEMTMSRGDLRARNLTGPFRLDTRSKDVDLEDTVGDIRIENEHADIEVHPKQMGNIEVTNRSGGIRLIVPSNSNFEVNARADRGEVDTDFNLARSEDRRSQTLQGVVNKGGSKVQLNSEHGTISIFKTEGERAREEADNDGADDVGSKIERKMEDQARKMEQKAQQAERLAEQKAREAEQKAREAERQQ